jgi:hypothetical protein
VGVPFIGGTLEVESLTQFHAGSINLDGKGKHSRARAAACLPSNPAEKI